MSYKLNLLTYRLNRCIFIPVYNKEISMKLFLKKLVVTVFLAAVMFQLAGCGETISGIGKDASRIGKGVKTIFIRE